MSTEATLPDDPAILQALLLKERELRRREHQQYEQFVAQRDELIAQHKSAVAQHEQTLREYEQTQVRQQQTIEELQEKIARLLRRLMGPKQERIDPAQLLLFSREELEELVRELEAAQAEAEQQAAEEAAASEAPARRRGHGRRPLPGHLPREQVLHELPQAERACPCCGEQRQEIGRETSEQLDYQPAVLKVIEHVRVKYACRRCEEHVDIAPKPPQPIEKGLPGPGLLAQVVLSKFGDHLPLYRQEDIFARHGVVIRRSTQCGWLAGAVDLVQPLYERMIQRVRWSGVIHTDDTRVPLLDPLVGHAVQARFWTYIGDERHPFAVYDFTKSRKRDGPAEFLAGYEGYLQADAYGGYDGIYAGSSGKIIEVGCWSHCRRYWWEARETAPTPAHTALGYIGRLFQLEKELASLSADQRRDARQRHALPILREFETWQQEQQKPERAPLPKSPLAKALTYTRNQWQALCRYCEDGRLTIDNNLSERTVKLPAIGRKNWLFVASEEGGRRAAVLFSLVASAKHCQVEPWAWLRDVFFRLPTTDPANPAALDAFLPDAWLTAHPEHRWQIDDLRRTERQRHQAHRQRRRRRPTK